MLTSSIRIAAMVATMFGVCLAVGQEKPPVASSTNRKAESPADTDAKSHLPSLPQDCYLPKAYTDVFGNGKAIRSIRVTPEGFCVVAVGEDGTLRSWHPKTRQPQFVSGAGFSPCQQIVPTALGRLTAVFAMAHVERATRATRTDKPVTDTDIWMSIGVGGQWRRLATAPGRAPSFDASRDGKWVVTTAGTPTVRLWDVSTGREVRQFFHAYRGTNDKADREVDIYGAVFAPDGKTFVSWGRGGRYAWHWDVNTGEKIKSLNLEMNWRAHIVFSPDSRTFFALRATSGDPFSCDPSTGRKNYFKETFIDGFGSSQGDVSEIAISPDGKLLVTAGFESAPKGKGGTGPSVRLWETITGQEVERASVPAGSLAFTPDGQTLIAGCTDGSLLFWKWAQRLPGDAGGAVIASAPGAPKSAWESLGDAVAVNGQRAVRTLIANPTEAVGLLESRLAAVPIPEQSVVARLIDALGHRGFAERERAQRDLGAYRESIRKELTVAAQGHTSSEARQRCRQLLTVIDGPMDIERLRSLRAVQALEGIGTPAANKLLEKLSRGAQGVVETEDARGALRRLNQQLFSR